MKEDEKGELLFELPQTRVLTIRCQIQPPEIELVTSCNSGEDSAGEVMSYLLLAHLEAKAALEREKIILSILELVRHLE